MSAVWMVGKRTDDINDRHNCATVAPLQVSNCFCRASISSESLIFVYISAIRWYSPATVSSCVSDLSAERYGSPPCRCLLRTRNKSCLADADTGAFVLETHVEIMPRNASASQCTVDNGLFTPCSSAIRDNDLDCCCRMVLTALVLWPSVGTESKIVTRARSSAVALALEAAKHASSE